MSRQTKAKPTNLALTPKKSPDAELPIPQASPMMNLQGIDLSSFGGDFSASLINLPALPQSPPTSPRPDRDAAAAKAFVPPFKSRVTSEQEQRAEPPQQRRPVVAALAKDDEEYRPSNGGGMSKIYHLRKNPGSTPELSLVGSAENVVRKQSDDVTTVASSDRRFQASPHPPEDPASAKRRDKGFRNPLSRTKSIRRDSNSKSKSGSKQSFDQPPKTAPLQADWQASSEQLLKAKTTQKRGKSAERAMASESEDNLPLDRQQGREKDRSAFVTGSKHVMNKAKTGGGHLLNRLGKIGRMNSHPQKDIPDSEYVLQVMNLPLIEQTRITRISKDLSSCRDKTEYWMPSLPWRCIDYLNLNSESEGLYRIPGSGPQVKHWQRRFDTELDVDLLDEKELYDPNIISSMLKAWLRDLPTEIFPKAQQQALADDIWKDNPQYQRLGEPVPQKLKDALSELPPFNYYLLFAITCHLSLLLSHKDKNKVDLNNLSICIGPCLDLDRWLFNYLVGDWRNCWQGCHTEKQFIELERAYEQGSDYDPPTSLGLNDLVAESASQTTLVNGRTISNGNGSVSRQGSHEQDERVRPEVIAPRRNENAKPESMVSSLPDYSQYVNGAVPTPDRKPVPRHEVRRPSTAQAEEAPEGGTTSKMLRLSTHSRSHSDLPILPVAPTSPIEFPFKVRNE